MEGGCSAKSYRSEVSRLPAGERSVVVLRAVNLRRPLRRAHASARGTVRMRPSTSHGSNLV